MAQQNYTTSVDFQIILNYVLTPAFCNEPTQ